MGSDVLRDSRRGLRRPNFRDRVCERPAGGGLSAPWYLLRFGRGSGSMSPPNQWQTFVVVDDPRDRNRRVIGVEREVGYADQPFLQKNLHFSMCQWSPYATVDATSKSQMLMAILTVEIDLQGI